MIGKARAANAELAALKFVDRFSNRHPPQLAIGAWIRAGTREDVIDIDRSIGLRVINDINLPVVTMNTFDPPSPCH